MKMALIIDKSESYIGFERTNVFKKWSVNESEVEKVESLGRVGEETIFGEVYPSYMSVNSLDQWKKLVADVEKLLKNDELEHKVREGLVITSTLARNSTKKLEEIVKKHSGEVIVAKESAKDKTNVSAKMLSSLSLNKQVKDFLVEYAADDYDSLVSVISNISEISPAAQSRITIEDMYVRLPKPPGSVAPWLLETPLFKGDIVETITMYRRITQHSHFLVVLSLLKNKVVLSWRIASLMQNNPRITEADAASSLGVAKNFPFTLAFRNAKSFGYEKMEKILSTLVEAEAKVKGGASADSDIVMELALIKIATLLSK